MMMEEDSEEREVFKGYNGHTMRRYPYIYSHERETEIIRTCHPTLKVDPDSNCTEIPVTEIDSYFDEGFWKLTKNPGYRSGSRPLNTLQRWENLEAKLEELAVKVVREFEHFYNRVVTHYHVPVTGHYLVQDSKDTFWRSEYPAEKKKQRAPRNFLHYNGKFYDPKFIYEKIEGGYDKSYLKIVCPVNFGGRHELELTSPCDQITKGKNPKSELLAKGAFSERKNRATQKSYNSVHKKEYLQIDLNEVCDITNIGSLGGYPSELTSFPPREEKERTREDYTRRAGKLKRTSRWNYVYLAKDPNMLAWVTSYTVEYRDVASGIWMKYGEIFKANHDIGTEIKHEVQIRARHIRIYPKGFKSSREMRIKIFGRKLLGFKDGKRAVASNLKEVSKGKSQIETLVYTLSPRIDSTFRMDGNGYRKGDYHYEGLITRNNRKNQYRKNIKEDIMAM